MAIENANISSEIVEANEYPDLIAQYNIDMVPKIVINDRIEVVGAQPEAAFVAQVVDAVQEPTTAAQDK